MLPPEIYVLQNLREINNIRYLRETWCPEGLLFNRWGVKPRPPGPVVSDDRTLSFSLSSKVSVVRVRLDGMTKYRETENPIF